MDRGPARHALLSVCTLQLHMLCSLCAFVMLERLSAAQVESKVDSLYVFWLLNGGIKVSVDVAALAGVLRSSKRPMDQRGHTLDDSDDCWTEGRVWASP